MDPPLSDGTIPQVTPTQLQQDFFSIMIRVMRKTKRLRNMKGLDKFLQNPEFNFDFEVEGISPLAKATAKCKLLDRLLQDKRINLEFCGSKYGRTCIFFAIKNRNPNSLRLLIDKGAFLDHRDEHGRTPLSLAAQLGHLDHAKVLVESGADINSADSQGWTPLFWALSMSHNETAKYLLSKQDISIDFRDSDGHRFLAIAAEKENHEIIQHVIGTFLAKKRPLVAIERDVLIWAILKRDTQIVQMLLENDASLVEYWFEGRAPLSMAVEVGDPDITRLLIRARAEVHAVDDVSRLLLKDEPLKAFLPPHELQLQIRRLLETHSSTNQPPLLLAARLGHVEILRALLNANEDVNSTDSDQWTALAWAVENGHEMAVVVLLDTLGVHVDPRISTGHTPLTMAARLGRTKIVELLLKSGANVNSEDDKKWTPLFWAVSTGREQAVELLLKESKTGVDHQDKYGRTPFSLAAEHSFIRIMNLLVDHGGDPHIPDDEGHTGFWWFLKVRHDLCIRSSSTSIQLRHGGTVNPFLLPLLIWSLPSPDRKDQSGRSWLSWAAEYGDEQVVEYFIERGGPVDFNVCDGNKVLSRTPLIWALERKNTGVIDLLKSHDLVSLHFLVEGISSIKEEHTLSLVMTLLQANYNPDQTDKNNRTPLHIACLKRDLKLVSALIEHNADTSLEDNNGKTPLQYALNRQSQAIINLLLGATKDIKSMQSIEWFEGLNSPSWIQLTRRSEGIGYILQSVNTFGCVWLPREKETRLSFCEKSFTWSSLPHMLGISDADCKKPCYWNFARKDHDHEFMNYISVDFPGEHAIETSPWGIAWTQKETANGCAKGFISKLPRMRVPNDFLDFFHSFLETLQEEWRKKCVHTNAKTEKLEREQLENYGKNHDLFENLAKNALEVTNLRQCLQSHIEGIRNMLECDLSFEPNRDTRAKIAEVRLEVTAKIDKMEQAVRSAMQTELSLISRNEAASFKRLGWITFIFMPLMFVSSLFGMNVNLLEDNPDWKWYIFFGLLSLCITAIFWSASRFLPKVMTSTLARKRCFFWRNGKGTESHLKTV